MVAESEAFLTSKLVSPQRSFHGELQSREYVTLQTKEFVEINKGTALGDNPYDFDPGLIPAKPETLETPRYTRAAVTEEERYMWLIKWTELELHPKTRREFESTMRKQANIILDESYGTTETDMVVGRSVDSLVNHFFR